MKKSLPSLLLLILPLQAGLAQVADPAPAQPPPSSPGAPASSSSSPASPSSGNGGGGQSSFLGGDVPFLDPGSELITWDGRTWNINNNRVFEARFEKYLNAPEETSKQDEEYNAIIHQILDALRPDRTGSSNPVDTAFRLLPKASEFQRDANLCDAIANQVYSAWSALKSSERLAAANTALESERKRLEWNSRMAAQPRSLESPPSGANETAMKEWARQQQTRREAEMQPHLTRLSEVNALMKANQLKREVSELQAKIEFQALIVHLFLQRRFEHVLIGTRFYRHIFTDGDSQLRVGDDVRSLFSKTSGMPPTIGTLDSMANEIIRDVRESVQAYTHLVEKNELQSATKRLAEAFVIGEYLAPIRTLPREEKRKSLKFVQKSNQLISALEVKDYALAETLVEELSGMARDFDTSKPRAAIDTAKTISAMHLAKAKNAAVSGDRESLERELRAATEVWPRNPALAEVSEMIFSQADTQQRALVDFDQLISQKNYRQIFDDRMRFIAATSMHPEKSEQLRQVLEKMSVVESAIIRAQEIEKRGDFNGAWESAERAFQDFPDDNKLNQVRADLTTKAAEFVRALRTAQDLERRDQLGSSLAWYLQAQRQYPPSEFAREGIDRLVQKILPDAQ